MRVVVRDLVEGRERESAGVGEGFGVRCVAGREKVRRWAHVLGDSAWKGLCWFSGFGGVGERG